MRKLIKLSLLLAFIGMLSPQQLRSQCNTNSSICTSGLAGPFNFVSPGPQVSTCLDWMQGFWAFPAPSTFGYIILHITTSGPLNMLIDGNGSTGYLDVAVFNIPPGQSPCAAIQNSANQIGCNYAQNNGGCNQFGTAFSCSSSIPAPNVVAGQELMIVVENWSGGPSSNFTLSLGPPPGAQTGPPNSTITPVGPFCNTGAPVQLVAVDMGGVWSGPGTSASGMFNPATAGPGTHTISYSVGVAPCNSVVSTTTITVNTNTVTVSPAATICGGGSTVLTASGSGSYTWSPTTGLSPTTGATVTASPATTTTYTVTGTTGTCSSTATVTVTVGGSPAVTASPAQSHCAGAAVPATAFTGGSSGTTYNWTNSNTAIGLGASGTGSLPAFTATNSTSAAIVSTITVTPVMGSCTGTPQTFTITVKPSPIFTPVTPVSVCAGSPVPASAFASTPAGATYNWTNSNTAIGLGASGTNDYASFTGLNSTSAPISGTITVTPTLNGCNGTAGTYTITVNPQPTMTTPANVSVCAGAPVAGSAFSPAGATFNWTNSNTSIGLGASGTGDYPGFTAVNAGSTAQTGTITVTPSFGTCTGIPVTYSITVNPGPIIQPVSDILQCVGSTVPASSYVITPATATATWTNSNTSIGLGASGSGNTPAFTSTNPGTGTISGTITVNASAFGCNAAPQTYTITIGQSPGITQPPNISQCAGTQVPASSFVTNPAGSTLNWTNSNTSIGLPASGTGQFAAFTGTNSGTTPVTANVTVTPSIGTCVGTPVTYAITINPQPTATASNNGPICQGGQINLSANSFTGATYSWTGPNSYTSNLQNPVLTNIQPGQGGTYTLTITSNGCSATASTTVVVSPGVASVITPAGPFCQNNGVVYLTVSSSGGTWSGSGITDPATGQFDASQAVSGNNTITYTPIGTCNAPATTVIVVNPIPTVQFFSGDRTGCEPHTALLVDQSSPASTSVLWDFGDGSTSTQTGYVAHQYVSAGCYTITLTSTSNGCSNTDAVSNYICVLPKADASFFPSNVERPMSNPEFQFFNTSTNATIYSWYFGDGGQSNSENPVYIYPEQAGNYTVTLIANNDGNCPDSAKLTVTVNDQLIYYIPNSFTPDGDEYNNVFKPIFYSGFDPFSFTMLIYDRWGEVVFESHDVTKGWDGTYNGELCPVGSYTWTVQFRDRRTDKKITDTGTTNIIR